MLPHSHVGFTLLAYRTAQKWVPAARPADYRLLALAALVPDIVDKPVVLATYRRWAATKLLAHTGLWHLLVSMLIWWGRPGWRPYALALNGHLLADRLWYHPDTLFWPGRGWHFQRQHRPGRRHRSLAAYWRRLRRSPLSLSLEIGGTLALLLFIWWARLFRPSRVWRFATTGRI